jgi:hypothetical protein
MRWSSVIEANTRSGHEAVGDGLWDGLDGKVTLSLGVGEMEGVPDGVGAWADVHDIRASMAMTAIDRFQGARIAAG